MAQVTTPTTTRLALGLAGTLGVLLALELAPELQRPLQPLSLLVAQIVEGLLGMLDMPVERHGTVLSHTDGFGYRIGYVCSGLRPLVLIAVALLALRISWSQRLVGILVAVAGIELLNFGRLIHLYWIGVHQPETFFVAHRVTWNVIAVVAVLAYLGAWLYLTGKTSDGRGEIPAYRE
jgi:exosortase/archaeosortase family protein